MDIGRALGITWEWMVCMLFRPFRMKIWLGLGFVVLMIGAFSGVLHGLFGTVENSRFFVGRVTPEVFSDWLTKFWPLAIPSAPILFLLVMWISSVFNFVFIDDISRKSAAIREPFRRLSRLGTSFFLWQVVFGLILLAILFLLIMTRVDVLSQVDVAPGLNLFLRGLTSCVICGAWLTQRFTIEFALVIMYARDIHIIDAWKTLLPILKTNLVQVVYYTLLRVLFLLATWVVRMVAALIAMRVFTTHISQSSAAVFSALLGSILTLPVTVFIRSLPMVMLGQTDPLLMTIPLNSRHAQSPGNSPLG